MVVAAGTTPRGRGAGDTGNKFFLSRFIPRTASPIRGTAVSSSSLAEKNSTHRPQGKTEKKKSAVRLSRNETDLATKKLLAEKLPKTILALSKSLYESIHHAYTVSIKETGPHVQT